MFWEEAPPVFSSDFSMSAITRRILLRSVSDLSNSDPSTGNYWV